MAMSLRVEDRLQGAQNYPTWKERMTMILKFNDVLDHVSDKAPPPMGAVELVLWKKGEAKTKSSILDEIKDHVVPHLSGKAEAKDMWKALSDLYQNKNEKRVVALCK